MNTALVKDSENIDTSAANGEAVLGGSVSGQMDFPRLCSEYNAFLDTCRKNGRAASVEYVQDSDFERFYCAAKYVGMEGFYWSEMGESGPYSGCYIDDFFERKFGGGICDLPDDPVTDSLVLAWLEGWEEGLHSLWAEFQDRALGHCEAGSQECDDVSDDE